MNPKAMHKLSYGLFVLTAQDENGRNTGCIINTAIQAASEPNTITICVNKANYTHDVILKTNKFNISMLSESATFDTFQHFGFQSGRDVDKFADFPDAARGENGLYYLTRGANMTISARVTEQVDLGSHTLFIGEVTDAAVLSDEPSCSYDYYRTHIKSEKQAEKKKGWVCTVCGYVYDGDPLPADFICPWCKHGAEDFVRQN